MLSSESTEETDQSPKSAPIVVFGEVLYDCFSNGESELGGAPFNVAWGLRGFGQSPLLVSAIGDDSEGQGILERMDKWTLSRAGLQIDPTHATGKVNVTTDNGEPSYDICEDRAWDFIQDEGWEATDLIYHGLLALRSEVSRRTFEAIVERSKAKRFFDINLRPPYDCRELIEKWVPGVDWLKLNIDELESLLDEGDIEFEDSVEAVERLRKKYQIANVLLTGGRHGARIVGDVGQAACIPAPEPETFVDTVGAGDSFAASILNGLLNGVPIADNVIRASRFAAKVCSLQGATTLKQEFYQ